jgi:intein/homing endonuclease
MADIKEEFLKLCVNKLHEKNLGDQIHKNRLREELKEIETQMEFEYFYNLYKKGDKFPENENNLLVPYILGLVDQFDVNLPSQYLMGEYPDIDTDFIKVVRDYLKNDWALKAFGKDNVCSIGSYGTFGIKSSLIDMVRVHDKDRDEILALTTKIGLKDEDGKTLTWLKALEIYPELKEYCAQNPDVADAASRLINRNRGMSKHAGGLIIANCRIDNLVPLVRGVVKKTAGDEDDEDDDNKDIAVSAFVEGLHGQDLGPLGLIKFDMLVINLMAICKCCKIIKDTRGIDSICALPGESNWTDLSYLNDPQALALANEGKLKGVFQFDSQGIRELAKECGVTSFDDIPAISSLYRPGPMGMGMHKTYGNRKQGKEKYELHPILEKILGKTYGVMCIHEDSLVSTNEGHTPIKNIKINDKICSTNIESKLIEIKDCHGCGPTKKQDGYEIILENGKKVILTEDHEILTWDGMKRVDNLDLNNDLIACPYNLPIDSSNEFNDIVDWIGDPVKVAYLFGLMTGDASIPHNGFEESFYIELIRKFSPNCKRIPIEIIRASEEIRFSFIAGLIDSDVHFKNNTLNLTSCSRLFLEDLMRILSSLGVIHILEDDNRIHIWGEKSLKLNNFLILKNINSNSDKDKADFGDIRYFKIKSINLVENQQFYAMSVADNHNLVANGIVVKNCYQEQIMKILNVVGGVPEMHCEIIRKAISKKKVEIFSKYKELFLVNGQKLLGLSLEEVSAFWDQIESFAEYGFNKSVLMYTKIPYLGGIKEIQDFVPGDIVFCINEEGKTVETEVVALHDHGYLQGYEVTFDDDYQITCSINHKFLTENGQVSLRDICKTHSYVLCDHNIGMLEKPLRSELYDQKMVHRKIVRVRAVGKCHMFDLEVANPTHNFILPNGIVTSNSHAVAYSYLSLRCLWLKAHYPLEFFSAVLSTIKTQAKNSSAKIKEYKTDAESMGIKVCCVDINKSDVKFSIVDDTIYMGFSNIKGIGEKVAEEIVQHQPYGSLEDFLKKFGTDSRVVEPLIELNVFNDNPLKLYEYYFYFKAENKKIRTRRSTFEKSCEKHYLATGLQLDKSKQILDKGLAYTKDQKEDFLSAVLEDGLFGEEAEVIWDVVKKYKRSVDGFNKKEAIVYLAPYSEFKIAGNLDEKIMNCLEEPMPIIENKHYGFSWQHLIEFSPDYVGGYSFADLEEDENAFIGMVEVHVVEPPQTRQSKKGTEYFTVKVEDSNSRAQTVIFWADDYVRFKADLNFWESKSLKGNFMKLRVKKPDAGFSTWGFDAPPKAMRYLIPKNREDDARMLVMGRPKLSQLKMKEIQEYVAPKSKLIIID